MTDSIRTMAVIPLEEYKQLINSEDDPDEPMFHGGGGGGDDDIPASLNLILECAPSRAQRQALLLLKYMAQLNGRLQLDEDSGELVIDDKHKRGSNLCDIIRILLTNRPGSGKARRANGIKSFLQVLSESALPANIIKDDYWRKYFTQLRNTNDDNDDSDIEML